MKKSISNQILINMVGFEYFKECIKNGATPEQAKAEMMTPKAQNEIKKRALKLVKL